MHSIEVYNPFGQIWVFTQQYIAIVHDELSNENAKQFYTRGWEAHDDAIAPLEQFIWEGWERHAEFCIVVFGPSMLMAIAAYRMWKNRNAPRLMPAVERVPVAVLAPMRDTSSAIDTRWIDWKAYLELLFKVRRVA